MISRTSHPVTLKKVVLFPFLHSSFMSRYQTIHSRLEISSICRKSLRLLRTSFGRTRITHLVVQALAQLRDTQTNIPVVMTGLPSDHRDPANKNFSSLLQAIAAAGLNSQITILGLVPYADLVNLMRTAALIIQPSRFEGWSTVVQDAVALGRPLLCSDIAVHREQVPKALGFFPTDRADVLAQLLEAHWDSLPPGPNQQLEQHSLILEREFSERHGKVVTRVVH